MPGTCDGFRKAMDQGEVVAFLRGDGAYRKFPQSDFEGEDAPTESWQVLQEIYAEAKNSTGTERVLSDAIFQLMEGTAGDFYVAMLYLVRLSLAKQGGRLSFEMPFEALLQKASGLLAAHREALSEELIFPNGFIKKKAMEDLLGWNEAVFRPCFGVNLFEDAAPSSKT